MKKILVFVFFIIIFTIFPEDFSKIDNLALNVPMEYQKDIKVLSDYIIQNTENDLDRARFIYRWITNNIKYNVQGFFSGNYGNNDAVSVFNSKVAVCEGYSQLFLTLSEITGLECVKINGYSKGYGYKPGKRFTGNYDHAWNAVKINGTWQLVDTTWGAGFVDDRKQFVFKFNDYYFCTKPEYFILSHYPSDVKWQLLSDPISLNNFEKSAYPTTDFFNNNLELIDNYENLITVKKNHLINIKSPKDILLYIRLYDGKGEYRNFSFIQYIEDHYEINLLFNKTGHYNLDIFCKKKDDPGNYNLSLSYIIKVDQADGEECGFPVIYPDFINHKFILIGPKNGRLKPLSRYDFEIRSSDAREIMIEIDGEWTSLFKKKDLFYYKNFFLKIKKGKVRLFAKYDSKSDNKYYLVMEYECY